MVSKCLKEVWRQIENYSGYEVSNHGRVRSYKHGIPYTHLTYKIRRLNVDKHGYSRITLCQDNILKTHFVHKLVLEAFVGKCPEGYECAHLDGNAKNNIIWNLRWVTPRENQSHKLIHGTSKRLLSDKQVEEVIKLSSNGYTSYRIAKLYNVPTGVIYNIVNGLTYLYQINEVKKSAQSSARQVMSH